MINSLHLKFGSNPGQPKLQIQPSSITVFVGPNNSGKSKAIQEIYSYCSTKPNPLGHVIIENVGFDGLSKETAQRYLDEMEIKDSPNVAPLQGHALIHNGAGLIQVYKDHFISALVDPNGSFGQMFSEQFLRSKTLMLNGRNRIDLVNDQAGGDLQQPPITSFQKLFRNDALRDRYSSVINTSFDRYAVIDPTNLGQLRLRLSADKAPSPEIERGLGEASVAFHSRAQHILQASDGAKAFTGILGEILAGNPEILLMDEPEAFLHPALAFNLGREIARSLASTNKKMFVSTHSPQFLMGCIQSGVPVNVIRLTYRRDVPTARLLPNSEIVSLMRNPLLRSAGVMSALFYESVVVTEADPDRAFYQEINERLLSEGRGIQNCIFLNAQNKQTIPIIVAPLRKLGIPAAAVYDIDFVKDGRGVATRFMDAAGIPPLAQSGLTTTRAQIAAKLAAANEHYKTQGGIDVLAPSDRAAAVDYFDQLDAYGAFVVRGGELESWLKAIGAAGHGPAWLITVFEMMGEDPASDTYVKPTNDDVWSFVDLIAKWLQNPQRKGIPA